MRADPDLVDLTLLRLEAFAQERGAAPSTVFKAAVGHNNQTLYLWLRRAPGYSPHPKTLAALNEWMDDMPDWRPKYKRVVQKRKARRRPAIAHSQEQ